MNEPVTLDKYFFQYVANKLEGAAPEEIVAYYVENLVFHNGDYLQYLQREYHLPNDILKLHTKIIELGREIE